MWCTPLLITVGSYSGSCGLGDRQLTLALPPSKPKVVVVVQELIGLRPYVQADSEGVCYVGRFKSLQRYRRDLRLVLTVI